MSITSFPNGKHILFFDFSSNGINFIQEALLAANNALYVVYTDIMKNPVINSKDSSGLANRYPDKLHFVNEYSLIISHSYDLIIVYTDNNPIGADMKKFISSFSMNSNIPICTITYEDYKEYK